MMRFIARISNTLGTQAIQRFVLQTLILGCALSFTFLRLPVAQASGPAVQACDGQRNRVMLVVAPDASLEGTRVDQAIFERLGRSAGSETVTVGPQEFKRAFFRNNADAQRAERIEARIGQLRGSPRRVLPARGQEELINLWASLRAIPRRTASEALQEVLRSRADAIRAQNPNVEIWLSYSGHGVNCEEPGGELVWCAQVPDPIDGGREIVSDRSIFSIVRPAGVFLDTCFAGRASESVALAEREGPGGQRGSFLFAASNGLQVAADAGGGVLAGAVDRLLSADPESACRIDLDGDGVISQREFATGLVGAFYNAPSNRQSVPGSTGVPLPSVRGLSVNSDPTTRTMNSNVQVPVSSNIAGACLLKVANPASCRRAQDPRPVAGTPTCRDVQSELRGLEASQRRITEAGGMAAYFRFLYREDPFRPTSGQTRSDFTASIQAEMDAMLNPTPAQAEARRLSAERRRAESARAGLFLTQWEAELSSTANRCRLELNSGVEANCLDQSFQSARDLLRGTWDALVHMEHRDAASPLLRPPLNDDSPRRPRR